MARTKNSLSEQPEEEKAAEQLADDFQWEEQLGVVPAAPTPDMPSFQDVLATGEVVDAASLDGDLYTRLDKNQKRQLCGVPFVIEDWERKEGERGEFVIVRVVTVKGERYSFTDGGMGIPPHLDRLEQAVPGGKFACKNGLRASDYEGPAGPATTYYLS